MEEVEGHVSISTIRNGVCFATLFARELSSGTRVIHENEHLSRSLPLPHVSLRNLGHPKGSQRPFGDIEESEIASFANILRGTLSRLVKNTG